jgi:hypothetical protein
MVVGKGKGNWAGRTQANDKPFAEMPSAIVRVSQQKVPAVALVALLGFVAALAALVIPNVIAILRG